MSLWPWLRALAAAGILAVLAWRLGTDAFVDGLRAIGPGTVLAALGIGLVTTGCSAWRWCVIARGLSLRLPLRTAVADYYRALLLNAVLPAGVLGDVHRAVSHGHRAGDLGGGVRAVVLERCAGQLALLTAGAIVLLTGPAPPLPVGPGLLAAAVVAGLCLLVPRVRRAVARLWRDARLLLTRRALPPVAVSSLATVTGHLGLFLVAARVSGVGAPTTALLPLLVLALLVMALPVNLGGFGPREAFLVIAFAATGLDPAQGLATSVAYGVLSLVAALPGVPVLISRAAGTGGRSGGTAPGVPRTATPAGRRTGSPR
ncbi:lysylphosphatidylglycerol synthase transmembrane domain-containing protein [Saccharopolyspora rhizosphaerae]|uniref:lysylphosphatidylglycerol synthase transmembrane domain-containing protein n=1 Tax=Saccharopolyspora rhizosphaerae TaxID=2492662 RepID=UPI0018F6AB9C|nr:lysylphosphatidylglycerol synthase transmembrane domain-containing protein [Saccharopolyspora rhizosphaerae]